MRHLCQWVVLIYIRVDGICKSAKSEKCEKCAHSGWVYAGSPCTETCTAASSCSGRNYDPPQMGNSWTFILEQSVIIITTKGSLYSWFWFLAEESHVVEIISKWTRMTLTNWSRSKHKYVTWSSDVGWVARVAGWHNGIIEGGALAVNGEEAGSIN